MNLPKAGWTFYGAVCTCDCHKWPNIMHVRPCCYSINPVLPKSEISWKKNWATGMSPPPGVEETDGWEKDD